MEKALPAIPAKRYFTIGEVSELCGVKPYVLRYWEQEFTQLKPMKRRGNRRYYQHHEVLLIRRIRELLYDQGFTISGARNRLADAALSARSAAAEALEAGVDEADLADAESVGAESGEDASGGSIIEAAAAHLRALSPEVRAEAKGAVAAVMDSAQLRVELMSIRELLSI
jgi:DNA-binding transcriptional MerR regulator